jgi:(5-formylfuran-3-yl)methyl phosphate synthase
MLASVRSAEEALFALNAGADLIDAKEPLGGALGAVTSTTLREIVADVSGRRPVSATVGDLPMNPLVLREAAQRVLADGADFVKIGFFDKGEPAPALLGLPRELPHGAMIAVLFADRAPEIERIAQLAAGGWHGVLLDTARKGDGSLRDWTDENWLAQFVQRSREAGLLVGLAGSLAEADIRPLSRLEPDVLGFRGALCAGSARGECLDPLRVRAVRAELDRAAG